MTPMDSKRSLLTAKNNMEQSEPVMQNISIDAFNGKILIKQIGDFTHITYALIENETGKTLMGIGNDLDEVAQRIQIDVSDYYESLTKKDNEPT